MNYMQYFAKYETNFDKEFLTQGYLYFPHDDENISVNEFEKLIKTKKDKKKNIAGTIFMYNPYAYPKGYNRLKSLRSQDFEFDEFCEVEIERELTLFKNAIGNYKGQLIEVRYLFNLNTEYIDKDEILTSFNMDVERLNTNQLTIYDRYMNYTDLNSFTINGKFVFFAWGHKITKAYVHINNYAHTIFEKSVQMQKKIAYVYKYSSGQENALTNLQFLHPIQNGRFKSNMPYALCEVFKTNPPLPQAFMDKDK